MAADQSHGLRSGSNLPPDGVSGFGMAPPTSVGGFGQFPQQPFPAGGMSQQFVPQQMPGGGGQFQGTPMMPQHQQQGMMMPGQGFPAQMMPMYSYPQQASYGNFGGMPMSGFPGGGGVRSGPAGFMPAPPPYSPQMAQNFQAKTGNQEGQMAQQQQKLMEDQRKKMEAAEKSRKFAEQQKRLKEFSSSGTSKSMDADSLIENILGGSAKVQNKMPVGGATMWPNMGVQMQPPGGTVPHVPMATSQVVGTQQQFQTGMMGTPMPAVSQSVASSQPQPVPEVDDGFGDFMTGPSANTTKTEGSNHNPGVLNDARTGSDVTSIPTNQTMEAAPPKQDKKDLESMMFECSDLNAPQKAKSFKKPSVKEVQPKQVRVSNFQASQKSRKWDNQTEELSDLFTLPEPAPTQAEASGEPQGNPGEAMLPKWCQGEANLPPLYLMVLEAATRDGQIDTNLVYPILMQSGLPREVLGHIWALANKQTPGQLIREELFMILALIALAQNNMNVMNLDILMKCPQPLVPILIPPSQQPPSTSSPPDAQTQQSLPGTGSENQMTSQQPGIPGQNHSSTSLTEAQQSSTDPMETESTFQPFQAAPVSTSQSSVGMNMKPASVLPFSGGFVPSMPASGSVMAAPTVAVPNDDDDFADFQQAAAPVTTFQASFADVKPVASAMPKPKSDLAPSSSGGNLIGEEDKYAALKGIMENISQEDDFADFRSASDTESIHSSTTTDSRDLSSSVSSYHSVDHKTCQLEGATVTHGIIFRKIGSSAVRRPNSEDSGSLRSDDKSLSPNSDDFADLRTVGKFSPPHVENLSPQSDDFADFQQADTVKMENEGTQMQPIANTGAPQAAPQDKIAALKMLVQKADLYKPKIPEKDEESPSWTGFQSGNHGDAQTESMETEEWADFESAPSSEQISSASSLFNSANKSGTDISSIPSSLNMSESSSSILPTSLLSSSSAQSLDSSIQQQSVFKEPEIPRKNSSSISLPSSTRVKSMFAPQNDQFDEFGTFHSMEPPPLPPNDSNSDNISLGFGSLPTPGSDEFTDFTSTTLHHSGSSQDFMNRKSSWKDASDSQSNSSLEFTGWKGPSVSTKNKEDAHSVSSLDLTALKNTNNKDSPVGMDSQSVSSLEFSANDQTNKHTPDQQSVSSLDFKTNAVSDHNHTSAVQSPDDDDDFGDFSSANVPPSLVPPATSTSNSSYIQNPIDASEVMTTGEAPMVGDRYSSIIPDVQDTDRHIQCWQRCLNKCSQMISQSSTTFNNISSSAVCSEVIKSEQGSDYLKGIVEIYRIVRRVSVAMKATSVTSAELISILKEIEISWTNLTAFIASSPIMPQPGSLDFQKGALNADMESAQQKACGVCLLNVDARSKSFDRIEDSHKVTYSGRQYHASCANFWVNCIEPMLPSLKLPELL